MATIPQILSEIWPGTEWTVNEDDYATLQWVTVSPSKPAEADIRSHSAEVDVILAARDRKVRQQKALISENQADYLLLALETIINGMAETYRVIQDMRGTIVGAAHTGSFTTWDAQIVNRMVALRDKIQQLRQLT